MTHLLKLLILTATLSTSIISFARANEPEKLALITNIDTPNNYCCWVRICTRKPPDLANDLEKIFLRRLKGSDYPIEVYHKPSQYQLFKLLTSKEYAGVFFVSHSTELDAKKQEGIVTLDSILDHHKADIKPILSLVSSPFFAFCGCYSNTHLNDILKSSPTQDPKRLFGFSGVVDAKSALRKSLDEFLNKRSNAEPQDEGPSILPDLRKFRVSAKRTAPIEGEALPIVQISANRLLLTMLPEAKPGETQIVEFDISIPDHVRDFKLKKNANLLTIKVSNGYNTMDFSKPVPGEIEFSSMDLSGHWQIYRRAATGELMGHNTNLYHFKDSSL